VQKLFTPNQQNFDSVSILRLPQVKALVGLSKSTLYSRIAEGSFPAPISLGGRSVGWIESEVRAWILAQIAASRPALTQHRQAA
jgi:prophage regulatory protein